jgi:predicted trehalose synthase
LVAWERSARRAFIDGYVAESRRGGARYLPTSDDDIRQALAAWELDKALYEVNYELNNRPDWLALPLAATLKLA